MHDRGQPPLRTCDGRRARPCRIFWRAATCIRTREDRRARTCVAFLRAAAYLRICDRRRACTRVACPRAVTCIRIRWDWRARTRVAFKWAATRIRTCDDRYARVCCSTQSLASAPVQAGVNMDFCGYMDTWIYGYMHSKINMIVGSELGLEFIMRYSDQGLFGTQA